MKNIIMKTKLILLLLSALLLIGCSTTGSRHRVSVDVMEARTKISSVQAKLKKIVLMLPFKGKLAATSKAIRNGFLAAYYHARKKRPNINIKVVDTTSKNVGVLYQEAVVSGADLVVGPLTKKEVENLIFMDSLPIPVIALNTLDDYTSNFKANLYQFGLLPQDEATQVGSKMMAKHYDQAAIIFPDNNWGNKIGVAIISGRKSKATKNRMDELGIKDVYLGIADKTEPLKQLKKKLNLKNENIAYIGDDLPDIPIMQEVGFRIAVADSTDEVLKLADHILKNRGGHGAVREACELILNSRS